MGEKYAMDKATARAYPEFRDGTEACATVEPEIFFPANAAESKPAIKVCLRCPLTDACLDWALATEQRFGIWGASSYRTRQQIKRQRGQR